MRDEDKTKQQLINELNLIRINENKYYTVLNNLWDGISVLDSSGNVVESNLSYCEMLGYEQQEIIGKHISELIHPSNHQDLETFAKQMDEKGNAYLESIDIHKDGSSIPVLVRGIPYEAMGQKFIMGLIQDISLQKKAEKEIKDSENKYHDLYENSPSAFVTVRFRDGAITRCNRAFSELIGYKRIEILNKKIMDLYLDTDNSLYKAIDILDKIKKGLAVNNCEVKIHNKMGKAIWLNLSAQTVVNENGCVTEIRSTLIDVSEQKALELSLIESRKVADKANEAKSLFLSHMSHELRTPMHSILGFSQLLESEFSGDDKLSYVEHILSSGRHLLSLMDDMLDLSKIDSGKVKLDIKKVKLATLINDCANSLLTVSQKNNINLEIKDKKSFEEFVLADETRLKQVVINLISNAIKYNREKGKVTVTGKILNEHHFRITVEDNGYGIDDDKQDQLFQPFNRLGKENTVIEGTGIGLVISKKLIESMAGAIGFSSRRNVGSRFWIDIPMSKQSKTIEDASSHDLPEKINETINLPKNASNAKNKHLLYVEDNPADALLMQLICKDNFPNICLVNANSAEQGIKLAEEITPNVIILDICLPGMSGLDALEHFKASPDFQNIHIIALTAEAKEKDIEAGLSAGFYAYLTKPVNLQVVTKAIHQAVGISLEN